MLDADLNVFDADLDERRRGIDEEGLRIAGLCADEGVGCLGASSAAPSNTNLVFLTRPAIEGNGLAGSDVLPPPRSCPADSAPASFLDRLREPNVCSRSVISTAEYVKDKFGYLKSLCSTYLSFPTMLFRW